jgi:hypothetical protein
VQRRLLLDGRRHWLFKLLGRYILSVRFQHVLLLSWGSVQPRLRLLFMSKLRRRILQHRHGKLGLSLHMSGWTVLSVGCHRLYKLLPGLLRPIFWLWILSSMRCWHLLSRLRILGMPELPVGTVSALHRLFRLLMLQCWLLSIDFRLLVVHRHMPCRTLRTKLRQWLY